MSQMRKQTYRGHLTNPGGLGVGAVPCAWASPLQIADLPATPVLPLRANVRALFTGRKVFLAKAGPLLFREA